VFYRGKDFLSPEVSEALLERERLAKSLQDEEEQARLRASALVIPSDEIMEESGIAGSLEETLDADAKWGKRLDDCHKEKIIREAEIVRHASIVRRLEKKLAFVSSLKLGIFLPCPMKYFSVTLVYSLYEFVLHAILA
jgi:hypothetical protein